MLQLIHVLANALCFIEKQLQLSLRSNRALKKSLSQGDHT